MMFSVTLQGEMQQLRDKLAVAERTAKAEAQLKVRTPIFSSLCYIILQSCLILV